MSDKELVFGSVMVIGGKHKGRIGYYDDDIGREHAIVYFGDMFIATKYYKILYKNLAPVTIHDLLKRLNEIYSAIGFWKQGISNEKRLDLLTEFAYIESELHERYIKARFARTDGSGKLIFISYSSKDKQFARWLSVDLANIGHKPWLDEWEIRAGESIPKKVADGIGKCDYLIVILSEHAIKSRWVENEWHAKYHEEIENGKIHVIPVLFKKCKIPTLLRMKKYANFTNSYNDGLEDLLVAISGDG